MCRADKTLDPFVESTVDGIIAGAVSVKVLQYIPTNLIFTFVLEILITIIVMMMMMMIINNLGELIIPAGHFGPVSL